MAFPFSVYNIAYPTAGFKSQTHVYCNDYKEMHVLYCEKVPAGEYRLAIWSEKDNLYYNDLKESEITRFITLIESKKRFLNNRTMDSIYNKYGFAVYMEIRDAHNFLIKKEWEKTAERVAAEYVPIIEKAIDKT